MQHEQEIKDTKIKNYISNFFRRRMPQKYMRNLILNFFTSCPIYYNIFHNKYVEAATFSNFSLLTCTKLPFLYCGMIEIARWFSGFAHMMCCPRLVLTILYLLRKNDFKCLSPCSAFAKFKYRFQEHFAVTTAFCGNECFQHQIMCFYISISMHK